MIVNQVGGKDDLIDGRSAAVNAEGRLFVRAKGFEEDRHNCGRASSAWVATFCGRFQVRTAKIPRGFRPALAVAMTTTPAKTFG